MDAGAFGSELRREPVEDGDDRARAAFVASVAGLAEARVDLALEVGEAGS